MVEVFFVQGTKCHDWDSNPHSDETKTPETESVISPQTNQNTESVTASKVLTNEINEPVRPVHYFIIADRDGTGLWVT